MEDKFDEIVKWYETSTGVKKENIGLKEIVRLRKLANMINSGVAEMEELKFKSLIEEESNKEEKG